MIKKIKVLQVIGSLRIGGAENVAMNICRYLDKNKYQCDFLVFGDTVDGYEKEAMSLGSKVIHIPFPYISYKNYFKNLKKVLTDGKYDVVHTHVLLNNGWVLKAAYDVNIKKRFVHSHSTNSGRKENLKYIFYSIVMKNLIRRYGTHFIACGKDAGNYLYGERFFESKGIVINNGIDIKKFNYKIETREKMRKEFGLDKQLVVGHIGRLAEVKNHNFLLDIFYQVNKLRRDSYLLIVGDGELRDEIENKIRAIGLEDKVTITGLRSDVPEILQAMDVFVFPSLYEGLPLTLIEAQSTGIPCLVSENVTPQIKVTDQVTFMSLKQSPQDWAKKIVQYEEYKRTDRSEEIVNKGFDVYTSIKELENLYEG